MRRESLVVLAVTLGIGAAPASAETRGTVRFGVMALDLESSTETPLFGDDVDRAVNKYNAAAAAYDRVSGGSTERIGADDVGMTETLFVTTPGVEFGGRHYFFRLEAPIGVSADLRSIGLGIYPLNAQATLRRGLAAYISAGGTASWLDRPGPGDVGGLLMLRAAAGVRVADRLVVELGYGAFALGGTVNRDRLDAMELPPPGTELPEPEEVLSAGEARGLVDISVGFAF